MATRAEVESLGTEEICDLLAQCIEDIDPETIATFWRNKINGKAFVLLTESDLRELVSTLGERKNIQGIVESVQPKIVSLFHSTLFIILLFVKFKYEGPKAIVHGLKNHGLKTIKVTKI